MPKVSAELPWKVLMDFKHDSQALLRDPIEDGTLRFDAPAALSAAVPLVADPVRAGWLARDDERTAA